MPQRRWYGAVLFAVVLVAGPVFGRRPDPVQTVDYRPPPAPPPSELEAAAAKRAAQVPTPVSTPLPSGAASVSLEVVGPATAPQAQPLAYEIVVRNTGAVAVGRVRVEDALPAGAFLKQSDPAAETQIDRLVWALGTLEPGSERRIKVVVAPAPTGDVGAQPAVSYALLTGLRPRVVRPALVVTQVAPETAQCGQSVSFEIRVTNTGAEPLQHVVLRDQIPPGLQFMQGNLVEAEVGTLAGNESKMLRLEALAVQLGRAVNEVTARAAGGLTARCEASVLIQEQGLGVQLHGTRQATVGGELNLRIELTNAGSKPARGVGLLLTLPDGIEPLTASTGGTVDPNNRHVVGWTLAALPNGERQTVTLKAKARVAGDWTCQAVVRAEGLAENKTTATLHIEAAPSLGLEVTGRDDAIDSGAETVYEMRVLNQGGVRCPGVRLVGQVAAGLQIVHAEGPTAAVIQGQTVQFDPLPDLPGRTEAIYRLRVRGQRAGDQGIRFQAGADLLPQPLQRDVNLHVNGTGADSVRPAGAAAISGPPR